MAKTAPVRVAIVDDHQLMIDGLALRLDAHPRIRVVAGVTTWGALLAHPEFPMDVVILDLNLDDGIPVSTKVRALNAAAAATVVISRHADSVSIRGAIRAGAAGFIPKTDPAQHLVEAVLAAAAGNRHESPVVDSVLTEPAGRPTLGDREERALMLYASGRSAREVAAVMNTTEDTAKSYIKRARRKYKQQGIDLGTKSLLRRQGIAEGWLRSD